jgi:hypothetical protein
VTHCTFARAGADAVEDAPWSAKRDSQTGYGIAVFDVDPGTADGGRTSITVTTTTRSVRTT